MIDLYLRIIQANNIRIFGIVIILLGFLNNPLYAQEPIQDNVELSENKVRKHIKKAAEALTWRNKDNSWSFRIDPRVEYRITYTDQLEDPKENHLVGRFTKERLRLRGTMFHPSISYFVHIGLAPSDFAFHNHHLYHALIRWQASKTTQLWIGQDFVPDAQEFMTPTVNFQLVDRSILSSKINMGFGKGIYFLQELPYVEDRLFRLRLALTTGENRISPALRKHKMQYTGRLEWLPFGKGKYSGYAQGAIAMDPEPHLILGGGMSKNKGSYLHAGNSGKFMVTEDGKLNEADFTNIFLDVHYREGAFSLYTEFTQRQAGNPSSVKPYDKSMENAVDPVPLTGKGFNIQTGYMLSQTVELAARFTTVTEKQQREQKTRQYTVGASKYFYKHFAKIQTDISYTDEPVAPDQLMVRLGIIAHL